VEHHDLPSSPEQWSETEHQEALFRWADGEIGRGRDSLQLLGAIPNGVRMLRWTALKNYRRLGFKSGMPDIYFFRPSGRWSGLFIELKSLKPAAKTRSEQRKILEILERSGYRVRVCRGYEEAIAAINDYECPANGGNDHG
jgi:hypothetical protein